jgi:hypothetical protein
VCIQRPIFFFLLSIDFSISTEGNVSERINESASEAISSYDIVGLVI